MEHGLDACGTTMEYDADAETINFTVSSNKIWFNSWKIKNKKFRTKWQYHLNSLMVLYSLLHHWAGISNVLIVLPLKSRLMKCQWMHHQELVTSQVLVSSMLRWGRLLKNNDMVNCHFRSNTIKSYWYKVFDNLSSFYSSNFLDTIPNAEHQVGQAINFGITFNKFKPINGLQFAPTSCEVINVNNEDEVYDLWNSNDDTMCNAEDHPVNFQVVETPETASNDVWNQFYGFKFLGNISVNI